MNHEKRISVGIDPQTFEFALCQVNNGIIFEDFAMSFLAQVLDYEFTPAGGLKDRGIDGLEHVFHRKGFERSIYQSSIEANGEGKLKSSLKKLFDNVIEFDRFYFVTNQIVKNQDKLIDSLFDQYKKPIHIYDLKWLSSRANTNQGAINTFQTFIASFLHEFSQPGKSYVVGDLVNDPRLFVFLRQQLDRETGTAELDTIIADGLILFALEGTDPDKGLFKTEEEIKKTIAEKIQFDPKTLYPVIDQRLKILSTKPRRVKHHPKIDAYCLPYETRLEIQQRNLSDACLHAQFQLQTTAMLERYLKDIGVQVKDCVPLMESAFNQIYYQQGLEFANFVLRGENQDAFEKDLSDTVSRVVDESSVVLKNKELVKSGLMVTIREIVYHGTKEQRDFLNKLSNTYLMLFFLQCDPKLATYFSSLASKLNIYVCTSILIPAMSEFFLEPENRRHWNLLTGARDAGVRLIANETIIGELASHFQMILAKYEEIFKHDEEMYLADEILTLYIDEILIRAYFYAKMRGQVSHFKNFIDNFVSPSLENAKRELSEWLHEEFGIEFVSDKSLGVEIDKEEEDRLFKELKKEKSAPPKAKNDANLILTIYSIREKYNEGGTSDIFGYRTWWLSKDTLTLKAVNKVFKDKYRVSCYMRPDFLYNYISLAPKLGSVKRSYAAMFPSLLGVNISYHLPTDIMRSVHNYMKEHRTKNLARRSAILQSLAEKLRIDPSCLNRIYVEHYLDEKLKELIKD
jgi:hypothetical protein